MKKVFALVVSSLILTGCSGEDACSGSSSLAPIYAELTSAWVEESEFSPLIESSSGGPIQTDNVLNLSQPQIATGVVLAISGELEWPASAVTSEQFWPQVRFSLVPQAYACSPGNPTVLNTVLSLNVSIANITESNLAPGTDVTSMFVVIASNKIQGSLVQLPDWNASKEFTFFEVDRYGARGNIMYLRFNDPSQFSGSTVTFDLHFVLRDGEKINTTTDEITFYN